MCLAGARKEENTLLDIPVHAQPRGRRKLKSRTKSQFNEHVGLAFKEIKQRKRRRKM